MSRSNANKTSSVLSLGSSILVLFICWIVFTTVQELLWLHSLGTFIDLRFDPQTAEVANWHPPLGLIAILPAVFLTYLIRKYSSALGVLVVIVCLYLMVAFPDLQYSIYRGFRYHPERIQILERRFGSKIDLCKTIKLGMSEDEVVKIIGPPLHEPDREKTGTASGHPLTFYQGAWVPLGEVPGEVNIRHTGGVRFVDFDKATRQAVQIDCLDGSHLRDPARIDRNSH